MAPHLQLLTDIDHDEPIVDLDLTDEQGLLAEDYAERHPEGTRALLAALNLKVPGATDAADHGERFDFAVYKATGDRHLASIFGRAA